MNLWFRLICLLIASLSRPRLAAPDGVSRLRFRVLPNDIDSNLHMTNGRYWTIFDLGRLDLVMRTGLGRIAWRSKWAPIVGAGVVQFRKELKPFQPFFLETRLAGWVGTRIIIEQRVLLADGETIASKALLLTGLYDRRRRAFVSSREVLETIGVSDTCSPPLSRAAQSLIDTDRALKQDDT